MKELPKETTVEATKTEAQAPQAIVPAQVRTSQERKQSPRKRMAFNSSKLGVDFTRLQQAGYAGYWFNDYPGRINDALANGYEFVSPKEVELAPGIGYVTSDANGERVSRRVGTDETGKELHAYLMKIPAEWQQENHDQAQERADAFDRSVKSGRPGLETSDPQSRFYGGVTVDTPR